MKVLITLRIRDTDVRIRKCLNPMYKCLVESLSFKIQRKSTRDLTPYEYHRKDYTINKNKNTI